MYIDFYQKEGAREFERLVNGERVDWLRECITCFACNEYCTKGAKPFDLILERLEELGDYANPKILAAFQKNFAPKGEFKTPEVSEPVISLCTIEPNMPFPIQGKLFDGLDPYAADRI
jgi:ferredoxin